MRAAYYEQNGTAREVLRVGEVETPQAGPGEVRVKLATSGVNPSDVKSRQGTHPQDRLAARHPAQRRRRRHRPGRRRRRQIAHRRAGLGLERAMEARRSAPPRNISRCRRRRRSGCRDDVSFEAGACLGIPAMTAYQAVALADAGNGTTLLVSGGAGVGQPIRHPVRQGAGRDGAHHRLLAGKGRGRARGRRRPRPSTTSARTSASG